MVNHQAEGLLNPGQSTAQTHSDMFLYGIISSFQFPAGMGLGATTIAASKLGNNDMGSTEICISNMFVSLGPVGGIVYLIVLFRAFKTILLNIRNADTNEGIAFLGLFICCTGQWLNGGHYALTALLWFCIGTLHRIELDRQKEAPVVLLLQSRVRSSMALSYR